MYYGYLDCCIVRSTLKNFVLFCSAINTRRTVAVG